MSDLTLHQNAREGLVRNELTVKKLTEPSIVTGKQYFLNVSVLSNRKDVVNYSSIALDKAQATELRDFLNKNL